MRSSKVFVALVTVGMCSLAVCIAVWSCLGSRCSLPGWLPSKAHMLTDRTPGELIRYTLRRIDGHPFLVLLARPPLLWVQSIYERPVSLPPSVTLGKGQQADNLPSITGQGSETEIIARTNLEIARAFGNAQPGQVISIVPGRYTLDSKLRTAAAGLKDRPITVRASQAGKVNIEISSQEGFYVTQPYWIFENLQISGKCTEHRQCEHAFHVVGKAHHTVIRNNQIVDFNAHIKVNGMEGEWPDEGQIIFNTLTNTIPRETSFPVTPIDMVGANRWNIADNVVSNFIKAQGDHISYGIFMKGAGRGGRIERNLVICTTHDISQDGERVGISFGGGGTGAGLCRDAQCDHEYLDGVIVNNIVAHCNDFGVDVNKSKNILIAHNTIINTAGIDVRNSSILIKTYGNIYDGFLLAKNNSEIKSDITSGPKAKEIYRHPEVLTFQCLTQIEKIPSINLANRDFRNGLRNDGTAPGAFDKCENTGG